MTIENRVTAQRAIEEVYWRHRIWPKDNPTPKPLLDAVVPESAIRAKVEDYIEKSNALDKLWQRPIMGSQLQAEIDRMARDSYDRNMLREVFQALGNDPFLIAETLARQTLAERDRLGWKRRLRAQHGWTLRPCDGHLDGDVGRGERPRDEQRRRTEGQHQSVSVRPMARGVNARSQFVCLTVPSSPTV